MRLTILCVLALFAMPAAAVEKYALTVYHFNIQYVQGGLKGFPDGMSDNPTFDMDDGQVQDQIITQSFEPILDMYLRHPSWGADIELQGYMVDIIAQRHPGVLDKMKTLAAAGKVNFVSFHWSDQLWVAYPRLDQERSYDLTLKSFQQAGLPHATSVWTQEGQFAMGLERFMRERQLRTAILPSNLFHWSTGKSSTAPLYKMGDQGDILCVVTGGAADDKVQVDWDFVNDGELAMTGKKDPYLGKNFTFDPQSSMDYEQQLIMEESNGVHHTSVAAFVEEALALGETPQPLPQIVDGAWQPDDTLNIYRWMGGAGLFHATFGGESDNGVHTGVSKAHRRLVAAEAAVAAANTHDYDAQITQAWQELLLGEGSDATGWNPWMAETKYSLTHTANALQIANDVLQQLAQKTNQTVTPVAAPASAPTTDAPLTVASSMTSDTPAKVSWSKRAQGNMWDLQVSFDASDMMIHRTVAVDFPRVHDRAVSTGSLEDAVVRDVPLSSIPAGSEHIVSLPSPSGLIGLADDLFLIQHTDSVHLAALELKDQPIVRFEDATASLDPVTWEFTLVQGTQADALAEAKRLNLDADVQLTAAPAAPAQKKKSGCSSVPGLAGAVLGLVGLAARRRRR